MKNLYLKRSICAALAGLILTLTACGEESSSKNTDSKVKLAPTSNDVSVEPLSNVTFTGSKEAPDDQFYAGYSDYAVELFKKSCADDIADGQNAMISAESVMSALGMTANGARGDTLSEMEKALGGQTIDKINGAMQYRMTKYKNSKNVKISSANSVWVRDDADRIRMSQDFCDKVRSFYCADTFLAPFDQSTVDDINSWVNQNTNEMIPSIIDNLPGSAVTCLVNAVSFEGEWAEPYEDYQIYENELFTNSKGEKENAVLLSSEENTYFSDSDTTGFIKYYKGGEYAFMAMLPSEGIDLADYVANIDGEKLRKLWSSADGTVNVMIPEFSFDYDNELSDELQSMGMELAFTQSADFGAMAETGSGELYISQVLHKTHIELDRSGTKAAAATAVVMYDAACLEEDAPPQVWLDRPFVYAIVDTETGSPIFMGAVNSVVNG